MFHFCDPIFKPPKMNYLIQLYHFYLSSFVPVYTVDGIFSDKPVFLNNALTSQIEWNNVIVIKQLAQV